MKISVILAHPNAKSFNHAIAETVVKSLKADGHSVYFHDLYKEKFDPVLPLGEMGPQSLNDKSIEVMCKEIQAADGIIIVHPNWWGQPPAIMKGWIDRVFRLGVACTFGRDEKDNDIITGLLAGKKALVFNTCDTPEEVDNQVFGNPLAGLWSKNVLGFCGVKDVHHHMFRMVLTSGESQRKIWLQEVQDTVNKHFPTGGFLHETKR